MSSSRSGRFGKDVISQLPEDIIILIALNSSIQDIFSLKQTCRRLNRVTDADYLWHRILPSEELSLDLSPFCDVRLLSARELRASALRALKLQKNWAARSPKVRNRFVLNQMSQTGSFDDLRLLNGGRHLIGIHRERYAQRPTTCVFVYSLDSDRPFQSANLLVSANMRDFDAFIDPDSGNLLIAAPVFKKNSEYLDVYRVILPSNSTTLKATSYATEYSFQLRQSGVFHKVSLYDSFMASSIINPMQAEGGLIAQVLITNWKTKQQFTMSPRFDNVFDQVDVKVLPPYLAIFSASADSVQVTLVPLSVIGRGGIMEEPSTSRRKLFSSPFPRFPTSLVPLLDTYDICISSNTGYGPYVPPTSISIIYFPSLSRLESRQCKKALHLRFAVADIPRYDRSANGLLVTAEAATNADLIANTPSIAVSSSMYFDIPVGSYPEHAQLGSTGRRAVWLEQSLKSDYVQLLRLDFDPTKAMAHGSNSNEPSDAIASTSNATIISTNSSNTKATAPAVKVNVLLPPEPHLPFKPSACRSLAFDEASGRLCIGLYNGPIFVLDYV